MTPQPPDFRVPIKSTWKDALGVPLTNRRITSRIKQGWYGLLPKLRLLSVSANKAERKKAREELKKYDGIPIKKGFKRTIPVDLTEFI